MSNNEDDECDSSSLYGMASQSDVNSFLRAQAAKITGRTGPSSISDDEENSMDGSLLARFTQIPMEKKFSMTNPSLIQSKPYLSRSCFASITSSPPNKSSSQKQTLADDLTELKWLNTFKFKEFNINDTKEKDSNDKSTANEPSEENQQHQNNDEDRLAKLISELKSYDNESTKMNTTSFGILIFLALYSKRDEKCLPWSLTIKQLYEFAQLNVKQITSKRGWKNSIRQALVTIPCFVKTKRDLLKSRSLWTIDPYYRPLLAKAFLTAPPVPSPSSNKTLSDAATNRHDEQNVTRSSQSILNNFAPKATVKTKVLPRLYERLCEEKVQDDDDDGDEADSSSLGKHHRSLPSGRKRPRSSSTSLRTSKVLKRQKHRHHRSSDVEPKTSTPTRTSNSETRSSTSTVVTPCPSLDHTYLLQSKKLKTPSKKSSTIERTGSIEYEEEEEEDDDDDDEDEDEDGDDEDDDERDSSSLKRKSIITTRAQAASRNHSKNRRKSSPPKKRLAIQYPSHRPNTRINRRIIEHDLKLLRQANVLPPLSPPTNQQPLDLSLGPNRSSSYEDTQDKSSTQTPLIGDDDENPTQRKTTPIEGVLDLSLSR